MVNCNITIHMFSVHPNLYDMKTNGAVCISCNRPIGVHARGKSDPMVDDDSNDVEPKPSPLKSSRRIGGRMSGTALTR